MSFAIPPAIVQSLRCPLCDGVLAEQDRRVFCESGHSFDRARQGHVFLRTGTPLPVNADSPAMVAARERVQQAGLFAHVRDTATLLLHGQRLADDSVIVDLAGGTGYYLTGVLEKLSHAHGICNELSTAALRRAARAHPRMAAVGFDVREHFPLASNSVSAVTSFFGPRNPREIDRVLRPGGVMLVTTPTSDHLAELAEPLGMLRVDERKDERLRTSLAAFELRDQKAARHEVELTRDQAADLVWMGPSAHHISSEEGQARVARLPERMSVTIDVRVSVFARPGE